MARAKARWCRESFLGGLGSTAERCETRTQAPPSAHTVGAGFMLTNLSFSCLLCAGEAADLSPSLSFQIAFLLTPHLLLNTGLGLSNTKPHSTSGCCYSAQGLGTPLNCNLDLKSHLLSLPCCFECSCPSMCHSFSGKAGLRSLLFLTTWLHSTSLHRVFWSSPVRFSSKLG